MEQGRSSTEDERALQQQNDLLDNLCQNAVVNFRVSTEAPPVSALFCCSVWLTRSSASQLSYKYAVMVVLVGDSSKHTIMIPRTDTDKDFARMHVCYPVTLSIALSCCLHPYRLMLSHRAYTSVLFIFPSDVRMLTSQSFLGIESAS